MIRDLLITGHYQEYIFGEQNEENDIFQGHRPTGCVKIVKPKKPADGSPLTFIGEPFYEGKIEDSDDALDAVMSVIDLLGGDENTVLEPIVIRPNEDGVVYYTFQQLEGDVAVYAATVKLIADADGTVL